MLHCGLFRIPSFTFEDKTEAFMSGCLVTPRIQATMPQLMAPRRTMMSCIHTSYQGFCCSSHPLPSCCHSPCQPAHWGLCSVLCGRKNEEEETKKRGKAKRVKKKRGGNRSIEVGTGRMRRGFREQLRARRGVDRAEKMWRREDEAKRVTRWVLWVPHVNGRAGEGVKRKKLPGNKKQREMSNKRLCEAVLWAKR